MKIIKVKAIVTLPNVSHIFKEGDILDLEVHLRKNDIVLMDAQYSDNTPDGNYKETSPAVIAKAGTYESYTLITSDGRRYSEDIIHDFVGYKKLSDMFIKI